MYSLTLRVENIIDYVTVLRMARKYDKRGFQRMIKSSRLERISKDYLKEHETFPNNIIIALNPDIYIKEKDFFTEDDSRKTITFFDEYNSLIIIDGQHRYFSFVKGNQLGRFILVTLIYLKGLDEDEKYLLMDKMFYKIIRKFPDFPDFQEIILTSPLGAIPRQFENVYPVNSYDISVTGEWDNEEKTITANMLTSLLEKYDKNIPIICHLEGEYIEIAKIVERRLSHTFHYSDIQERITSKESLLSLENLIRAQKDIYVLSKEGSELEYITKTWHRKFIRILDYQYEVGAGLKILPNELKLRKNRANTRIEIVDNKTRELLGVYKHSSGFIELSIKGAIRLSPFSSYTKIIIFNGDKIKGNTLFRPGILDYNSELYPRDNIIILDQHKKNVIGVGNMIVSSNFIKNSMTGRIAKIYERDK